MKLTFILPGRGFSGGIRCGARMGAELLRKGHDTVILYRKQSLTLGNVLRSVYIRLVVRAPRDWVAQLNGECASFKNLTAELVGKRDIVMAIGPDCVEEMIKLSDECGCKVFYAHGLTLRNSHLREIAWGKKIPKIAVSNYVHQEILRVGINDVIAVVPNGVDISEYFPDETESNRAAVGTVYSPGVAKDPKTIMSVFAKLHQLRPNIPLACFGSVPRPKELIQTVQYKRLPTVAEARKLYSTCSVWFCASHSEGFGMPLLEAMACGCAAVCTDCGGPNDFLKPGINGIIVEKEAPAKIVEEIIKIIDDKSKQKQLADEAIRTAKMLSWSSAASQMEIALEAIVSGRREN